MIGPTGFRSLRWRLTALIGVVLVLAVGSTFLAIYHGTGAALRHQVDRELHTDSVGLATHGVPSAPRSAPAIEAAAASYLSGQPFRPSSRLQFLRVRSRRPVSNEPDLLRVTHEPGETPAHQRLESARTHAVLTAPPGYSTVKIADVGDLRLLITPVRRHGATVATIGVGEPLAAAEGAQREVARTFVLAGSITLLVALLAGYLIALRTSRPLARMARVAQRVDGGDLSPRMAPSGPRDEVRVLAESFDHMLDRLSDAFERQRAFAADASHELRTPLTVIRGQLEVLARQSAPSPEDVRHVEHLVRTETIRMQRLVEDLLVLARAEQRQFLLPRRIDLEAFVVELFEGVSATAERRFELSQVPAGTLEADPDRLAQALRNAVRNAIEHTASGGVVRLTVRASGDRVSFVVEDDGPGIPSDQRDRVFDRFHRTDRARTRAEGGTGLGLAIVRAVAEAHGGSASVGSSPQGGAALLIELPGFEPDGRSPPGPETTDLETAASYGRGPPGPDGTGPNQSSGGLLETSDLKRAAVDRSDGHASRDRNR